VTVAKGWKELNITAAGRVILDRAGQDVERYYMIATAGSGRNANNGGAAVSSEMSGQATPDKNNNSHWGILESPIVVGQWYAAPNPDGGTLAINVVGGSGWDFWVCWS
jgi:hypothetical protein